MRWELELCPHHEKADVQDITLKIVLRCAACEVWVNGMPRGEGHA